MQKKIVANQNGEEVKKAIGSDCAEAYNNEFDTASVDQVDLTKTVTVDIKEQTAVNDNNPDGDDDNTPPSSVSPIIEMEATDDEGNTYQVYIDVDEVSNRTYIQKNELIALCNGGNFKEVAIPLDKAELQTFISVQQGKATTARSLSRRKTLSPEARKVFLRKAQEYGYLWLKGEVQLGNELRKIVGRQGKRSDLKATITAANDNNKQKKHKKKMDKALDELRTKKEILKEDYGISYTQARQLIRLTDELVEREYEDAVNHNECLSRNHALGLLNRPPEMSDEEKDEANAEKAIAETKAKFEFETVFSDIPFNRRMRRKLKKPLYYASVAACVGSDEYYLEQHGFVCKIALEPDPDRADYFELMQKSRSKHDVHMIIGKLEEKFDELVEAYKKNNCEMVKFTIPCQCFCRMRGKNWRDDDRLLIILWCVKFIKAVKPKYILFENAKEFLGFSLPMSEDLSEHPIAQKMQQELNGRTIGQYLEDELGKNGEGYNLNSAIENAAFYGTAQNRVRSIVLGSLDGIWKFPCPEEFAMTLWQAIGHLPSIEAGEDSGIPYHYAPVLDKDPSIAEYTRKALSHLATGCRAKDNDPEYQLSGFGFFDDNATRKFWDRPSNTIDSGNGCVMSTRTLHPGRIKKDGTFSDSRVLSLLEVFLTNGLPQSYEVPKKYRKNENFIREVMGEIMLPRLLERICLEAPIPDDDWEEVTTELE